ncbi:MAG: ABC transporter permease [Vicinamibacterales bacterium]
MMAGLTRVRHLITKELLELRADPRLFGIVIMAPIIQLVLLGYAATTDVKEIPLLVVDDDRTAASRDLIERFAASANFTVVDVVTGNGDVDRHLEYGTAWMALTIPQGMAASVASGRPTAVQVIADGTDSNSTGVALGYARSVVAAYSADQSAARLPGGRRAPPIDVDIRVWFNPQLESRDFMVPGIVALLLLVVTTNLSAMAIVREREVGTLEQLNVTPLQPAES